MAKKRRKLTLKPSRPEQSSPTTDVWQKPARLLTLPLEIIFEILGYLLPRELVALSRTNKALRETIYSQGMAIWRSARMAVGAPECAPGFSERQWAILLFGGPTCGTCGTRDAPGITFSMRRRICSICMRMNLVSSTNFAGKFPDFDPAIFEMAPYMWVEELQDECCWVSDLERIGKEWKRLKADVDKGVSGAKEKSEAYWDETTDEADRIMQHAKVCDKWLSQVVKREAEEKWNRRSHAIRERLVALGYEERDIPDYILGNSQFHVGEEITKRLWASIRPGLVTKVKSRRDARLTRERDALRNARMHMLEPLYDAYAQSLPPRQWIYLPDIHELIWHPRFRSIIHADSDANITQSSFLPAVAELPTLVPAMISSTKARVTSLLGPVDVEINEPLDLATSVFEHPLFFYYRSIETPVLISWDVVAAHACKAERYTLFQVKFSNEGSAAAAMLVRAAGLDPVCATNAEMDALDLRFSCRDCAAREPLRPKVGYPWKPAIEHTLKSGHMKWRKIFQEDTVRIKQAETYREDNSRSWSCSHCTVYFKSPDTKPRVVQHLNDAHGILSPTEPGDIFWYSGRRRHPPSSALASLDITPRRSKRKRRTVLQ
ncbi:hypothetical protein BD779DRAFT_278336 [Infundibulicybe gibba]|nr:hypothetical protein BD779DRAFT_278336 [Infundibulicybe gibba]